MVELNEKEQLEELKEKIGDIKSDLVIHIEEQFNEIFALINGRIEDICDEEQNEHFPDEEDHEEYEERDVCDELTTEQAEEASVLSRSIASQIQRASQENSDEEAPVVVINSPAPSLAENIKKQIDEVKTVATETPVSLTEQIAKQVADKNNIAVVVPAASEGIVDIPQPVEAAPRPLGQIIEELRSSVKTGVDATSAEKTEQLVEQAATQTPDANATKASELAQDIKVQVLSDSIKKQL
ncbi:hypothetical protein PDK03_07210 [Bacillus cereus group sp. TH204-1LC]|uniref:hypothetical protein n=1 Tax=Bacillus cereus group sp. TH204-1LC TaxID=3018054 RepID=UPI0022E72555|nr:hypothetical protein [Bacillus cereus group sp. TH204-1LC]MDA1616385.1 hypothetical protein [Bacillus cereus group sp. TH204-1LC]